ncbi:MAG TPA: Gfo/Idh/MocA family oxidoreductase [Armatimonadota bacterium]|nr:Gfo/Idh/MocA family oxidoreductase [Armatimonadota bacterium]
MSSEPASRISRRRFLQQSAMAGIGVGFAASPGFARPLTPNDKLNIGAIGVANRGGDDLSGVSSENIVALCDVDDHYLDAAISRYPKAARYNDYRKMLERNDLDAVVVATPDHNHAMASVTALRAGLHLYCEKPLAHTVAEARIVTDLARKMKCVTQLGTQIHAGDNYRRVVELVQSGAIGPIKEVHVWCSSSYSGNGRPTDTPPTPANLHYDLWLGPAQYRPYNPAYVPFNWRSWWAFGEGSLGDFGCHYMDLPFWALNLKYPLTVKAEGPPVSAENTPAWLIVHYTFPARETLPAVDLTWYHGGKRPTGYAEANQPDWPSGVLFVGAKGRVIADYGRHQLLPEKDFEGFTPPPQSIPNSIGHHQEWIHACKTGGPTTCNFDYSGPLSETVLLGNVSYRVGKKLNWDADHVRATNSPESIPLIWTPYRWGWSLQP